jgi:hypothetical protein
MDVITPRKFTKNNVYQKEQEITLNKILMILDLQPNDGKRLDRHILITKFEEIEKLLNDVQTYYPSNVWKNLSTNENKAMSIIRSVLKHHGYKWAFKGKKAYKNNKDTTVLQYFILQPEV